MAEELQPCRRGDSFDEVADLYDRYRPAPPTQVVDALIKATGIGKGTRVVEFGCGTGQLSVPLAATGSELTSVEPGARLAAIAARNLSRFPLATVESRDLRGLAIADRPVRCGCGRQCVSLARPRPARHQTPRAAAPGREPRDPAHPTRLGRNDRLLRSISARLPPLRPRRRPHVPTSASRRALPELPRARGRPRFRRRATGTLRGPHEVHDHWRTWDCFKRTRSSTPLTRSRDEGSSTTSPP